MIRTSIPIARIPILLITIAVWYSFSPCSLSRPLVAQENRPDVTIRRLQADEEIEYLKGDLISPSILQCGTIGTGLNWMAIGIESELLTGKPEVDRYVPGRLMDSIILLIDLETKERVLIRHNKKSDEPIVRLNWERIVYETNSISLTADPTVANDSDANPTVFEWKLHLNDMSLEYIGSKERRLVNLARVFDPSNYKIDSLRDEHGTTTGYSICQKHALNSSSMLIVEPNFRIGFDDWFSGDRKQRIVLFDVLSPKLLVTRLEPGEEKMECFSLKPNIKSLWTLSRRDLMCMFGSPNAPICADMSVDVSPNSNRTDVGILIPYADVVGEILPTRPLEPVFDPTPYKNVLLVLDGETARVLQRVQMGDGEPWWFAPVRSPGGNWVSINVQVPNVANGEDFAQRVVNLRSQEIFEHTGCDESATMRYFAINDEGIGFYGTTKAIFRVDCKKLFVQDELFRVGPD